MNIDHKEKLIDNIKGIKEQRYRSQDLQAFEAEKKRGLFDGRYNNPKT